jgi:chaperone required for assembly of F1-ATPase
VRPTLGAGQDDQTSDRRAMEREHRLDKRRAARHIPVMSKAPQSPWFPDEAARADPRQLVRAQAPRRPKRFYRLAQAIQGPEGFGLMLDGRPARTPARRLLAVPSRPVAEAMAAEWNAQRDDIDPARMPVTRLVNSALDGVATMPDAVAEDAARYARCDLICYRADAPRRLVDWQKARWDPVLDWARSTWGARFITSEGVVYARQPAASLEAIRRAVARTESPLALAGLHAMTTLTGSVLLALAVTHGHLSASDAWSAAHVDEDFQAEVWGADAEAQERRAGRWAEMEAASLVAGAGIRP